MNIKAELLKEHTKKQTQKIAHYIGDSHELFEELMAIFFSNKNIVTQRAAWAVRVTVDNCPMLIKPYISKILDNLNLPVHDAVKRNALRIFQNIEIPLELCGKAVDVCFRLLSEKGEPVAVKVFAMTVIFNISKGEPELQNELKIVIEEQLPYASAGYLSRAKKILKQINRY